MSDKELTYKEVWDKLSKIDCSEKIEKKGKLTYLSWAWAWGVLQEHYPQAQYLFYQGEDDVPYVRYPDGTGEVRCRVSIVNLTREMTLCVMDFKNNAVKNPNSSQVNNSKMRCLTKCLAMFGLGHYIYAGEDLPEDVEDEIEYNATINKEIDLVKSFQDMGEYDDIVGAVVRQGEGDVGITYMFKDDYDALEDKSKFENDYGYPPQDIKIAGKDLKFFTFTI